MASFTPLTFEDPIVYTIIRTGPLYCIGLKMEKGKPGPHFLRIDDSALITTQAISTAPQHPRDWREFVEGDAISVAMIHQLDERTPLPEPTTNDPCWGLAVPKPSASVNRATLYCLAKRRTCLAFIAIARKNRHQNKRKGVDGPFVKFYDPMTLREETLPLRPGQQFREGDPILVDYVIHPYGTGRPTSRNYVIPHDCPFPAVFARYSKEDEFAVLGARKLTGEELSAYERIFNRADGRDEHQRAQAMEEVLLAGAAIMQSMVDADMRLQVQTIQPVFERYDKETKEMIFKASYYAAGEDKADDLAKAARILRINQHVLVVPGTQKGNMAENFALAHIRKSKLYEDRIEFCLAVAENTADALWDDCWESVTRIPWTFKPTRTQVLQRHFLNKLRDGALRQLMTSSPSSAPQQIIRALFGDMEAIPKAEARAATEYLPTAVGILTEEQSRGVAVSLRDDIPLSTVQAPAGSGKTTTIAAMLLALTAPHKDRCVVMTSAMNIAIDTLAKQLAEDASYDDRRVMVLQSATYLTTRTADDPYHDSRLPRLLVRLAQGAFGSLNAYEEQLAKDAVFVASKRYKNLIGMDWGNVLHGEITMESRERFIEAVGLLVSKYKPQIILGTTSALNAWAETLADAVTDVVIDEAGTVSTLDAVCFVMTWKKMKSLTMVGDINQLPNFTAPLPDDYRKWGFESALRRAREHPSNEDTALTQVFRSHPALVDILSQFAYENPGNALRTSVTANQRSLMQLTGLPCGESPILIVDCSDPHKTNAARSFSNAAQALIACAVAGRIHDRCGGDVRFLTMYSGARDELNEELDRNRFAYKATAVDAAQGQECDITVLETALKPNEKSNTRFFGFRERLTVAISRARHGLVIIGSVPALRTVPEWDRLISIVEQVCPGAIVSEHELRRDIPTPATEMAMALGALGLPSAQRTSTPCATDYSGGEDEEPPAHLLPPPPPPPVLSPVLSTEQQEHVAAAVEVLQSDYDPEFEELLQETREKVQQETRERARKAEQMEPAAYKAPAAKRAPRTHLFPSEPQAQVSQKPLSPVAEEQEREEDAPENVVEAANYVENLTEGEIDVGVADNVTPPALQPEPLVADTNPPPGSIAELAQKLGINSLPRVEIVRATPVGHPAPSGSGSASAPSSLDSGRTQKPPKKPTAKQSRSKKPPANMVESETIMDVSSIIGGGTASSSKKKPAKPRARKRMDKPADAEEHRQAHPSPDSKEARYLARYEKK